MTYRPFKTSFQSYPEVPLISVMNIGVGFGKKAIEYLKLNKKSFVIFIRIEEVYYLAILPFDSKIEGYSIVEQGKNNMVCGFKAHERGFETGYYKLLEPIFELDMDLFELERFELMSELIKKN